MQVSEEDQVCYLTLCSKVLVTQFLLPGPGLDKQFSYLKPHALKATGEFEHFFCKVLS